MWLKGEKALLELLLGPWQDRQADRGGEVGSRRTRHPVGVGSDVAQHSLLMAMGLFVSFGAACLHHALFTILTLVFKASLRCPCVQKLWTSTVAIQNGMENEMRKGGGTGEAAAGLDKA